jgi:hypothetical protein
MSTNLAAWALAMLGKLAPVNAKVEEAWPHLKNIGMECKAILTIFNGGKPVMLAGGPTTTEGSQLASKLISAGVPANEANETVAAFDALHGRLAS